MSAPTVTLTGWKAVAVIAVVVGFGGFRFVTARESLDTQGHEVLQEWIAAELMRPLLTDSTVDPAVQARAILDARQVRIRSMTGRGPLDDMVVRVEVEPDSGFPEGTETTRFYRMEHSSVTGWRHRGSATALSYYLAFF